MQFVEKLSALREFILFNIATGCIKPRFDMWVPENVLGHDQRYLEWNETILPTCDIDFWDWEVLAGRYRNDPQVSLLALRICLGHPAHSGPGFLEGLPDREQ